VREGTSMIVFYMIVRGSSHRKEEATILGRLVGLVDCCFRVEICMSRFPTLPSFLVTKDSEVGVSDGTYD